MINKVQPIYPSSRVSPEEIHNFGWRFIEEIPSRVNHEGHIIPIPEASVFLRGLRTRIDFVPTVRLQTENETIVITDFAVAPTNSANSNSVLGFYVLDPKVEK